MYYAYILRCDDGTLYTGSTNNLRKRLHQHNFLKSGAHYTKIRRPVRFVYTEKCATFSIARSREAAIKSLSRKEKELLISASARSPDQRE